MTPTLIVLAVAAFGIALVIWAVRKTSSSTATGPKETDTAWNDPVSPGRPAHPLNDRSEMAPRRQIPQEPHP